MDTDRMCVMSDRAAEREQVTEVTYASDDRVRAIARAAADRDAEILERLAR